MTKEELLELKVEIEESQAESTRLQARKDLLLEQLQKKYKVKNLGEAKKKLKSMQANLEALDEEIEKETEVLEEQLNEQDSDDQE